ncbi:MAG: RNB domain-containing ribonuclease [Betaproteobacteria bacterium]|nr:RNB domain-containing ribonuclease [Betaproteobacteria bacterium]
MDQTGNTPKQGQPARQGQDRDRGHPAIELDLDQKGFADPPGTDEEIGQTKEPAAPKSAPQSMGRARMSTHPMAHQGLGVGQYIWATSPLRRYADLVNQRQLLALATRQRAPFIQEDADLHRIIAAFDGRYDAYNEYQQQMERFWSLRWVLQLQQAQAPATLRLRAVALREQRARLREAPLVFTLADMPDGHAGRGLVVEVLNMDWLELSLEARMLGWDDEAAEPNAAQDGIETSETGNSHAAS